MPARASNDQADYLIMALLPMDHPDYNAELFRVSMPGHTADGFTQMPSVPEPVANAITGAISDLQIATEPIEVSGMI